MKPRARKYRRLRPPLLHVAKSMGKWLPADDFLLIQSINQLNDLNAVKKLTKFSTKFTFREIKRRWFAILYDAKISKMIYNKIRAIHSDDVLRLKRLAPFSDLENQILIDCDNNIEISESFFDDFLLQNRISFHESRTGLDLYRQWQSLQKCCLLKDQSNELEHNNKSLEVAFNLVESRLSDDLIIKRVESNHYDEKEMNEKYNLIANEIKKKEAELFLWQVLADKVTGRANPFTEPDTIAVLFCEQIEFKMKKREIIIGRSCTNVDIDLSLIEKNKKISRIQCKIILMEDDVFFLINKGSSAIFLDGEIVIKDEKKRIKDQSIIVINKISLLFLINYNNISPMKK